MWRKCCPGRLQSSQEEMQRRLPECCGTGAAHAADKAHDGPGNPRDGHSGLNRDGKKREGAKSRGPCCG